MDGVSSAQRRVVPEHWGTFSHELNKWSPSRSNLFGQ